MAGKASLLASGFFILGWREPCGQLAAEGVGRGCLARSRVTRQVSMMLSAARGLSLTRSHENTV